MCGQKVQTYRKICVFKNTNQYQYVWTLPEIVNQVFYSNILRDPRVNIWYKPPEL